MKSVHSIASKGFTLQSNLYELIPKQANVIDLAAGTGIMTKLLVDSGYQNLIAVEPVENMRYELHRLLPHIPCLEGTAWKIPVDHDSQDGIVVAQAFHWFDDLPALREFHRILRSGGHGVLVWNLESAQRSEWVAKLRNCYEVFDKDIPQFRKMGWRKVFDTEEANSLFKLPIQQCELFKNDFWVPKDHVWKRILSKSYISCLDKAQQDELEIKVNEIMKDVPTDDLGRVFYPHDTYLFYFEKK
ncbi:S-adenosyl-L-methionine-dependent methyltransferase [Cokeromyces recurvatus]|uniref:S-adenosyl-L-methionine-dependent methyltransferase n=1 Tax=Cokeromyces recurvatus TaxID=90255 RepID=UPI00221E5057|nr:S-adenosyl-L-methionine-dependent methyltransferase [Cokeromyces recurvatus]KAI7905836.1 S-adenosyl-L-methionine-dependent methyltransferase [Cokeromyces recurvatus]